MILDSEFTDFFQFRISDIQIDAVGYAACVVQMDFGDDVIHPAILFIIGQAFDRGALDEFVGNFRGQFFDIRFTELSFDQIELGGVNLGVIIRTRKLQKLCGSMPDIVSDARQVADFQRPVKIRGGLIDGLRHGVGEAGGKDILCGDRVLCRIDIDDTHLRVFSQ